jgi:hypothetical protein
MRVVVIRVREVDRYVPGAVRVCVVRTVEVPMLLLRGLAPICARGEA